MPKVSEDTATQGREFGPVTDRSDELDGYTVGFTTFQVDMGQSPMLNGLPDDQCQCPHWGYVIKGRFTYRSGDREEVFEAGDAFYLPPGHVGIGNEPGSQLVQFSPSEELKKTEAVIMKNMQAMQAG